jgi:hypothetical protein
MSFFDEVNAEQSQFFIDGDLMGGELITYVPERGPRRTIWAIVNRQPKSVISELPGPGRPVVQMTITVRNDSRKGISIHQLDTGKDRVELARRKGGEVESRAIASISSHDAGMITLEIR